MTQARFIFNAFILTDSQLEINIRHETRSDLIDAFNDEENIDETIFDEAEQEVLLLLTYDSFQRLKLLSVYQKYWEKRKLQVANRQTVVFFDDAM